MLKIFLFLRGGCLQFENAQKRVLTGSDCKLSNGFQWFNARDRRIRTVNLTCLTGAWDYPWTSACPCSRRCDTSGKTESRRWIRRRGRPARTWRRLCLRSLVCISRDFPEKRVIWPLKSERRLDQFSADRLALTPPPSPQCETVWKASEKKKFTHCRIAQQLLR